jgi:hypothetical protein
VFCLAWKRPITVAAVLFSVASLMERLQALTPDRTADFATALFAAAGVASAALLAALLRHLRRLRGSAEEAG